MAQVEKTEAAIEAAWTNNCHDTPADVGLEAHARDLARKLDRCRDLAFTIGLSADDIKRELRTIMDSE